MTSRILVEVFALALTAAAQAQDLEHPLHIGGQVKPPVLIDQKAPNVSTVPEAERRNFHGANVYLVVDTDGLPKRVRVVGRSGSPKMDAAVLDAIRTYRVRPGTRDGVPVAVEVFIQTDMDFF